MNEMLTLILDILRRGESLAAATIMTQAGSSPRTAGAKMLVDARGLAGGSVGGGLLEARSLEAAARVLAGAPAEVLDFDLSGDLAAGADMICGGRLQVFVELLRPADRPFFEALAAALAEGRVTGTATRLNTASDGTETSPRRVLLMKEGGSDQLSVALGDAARGLLCARALTGPDGGLWFVEPWPTPPRLILAGGGHVALATAAVAEAAGFEVVVLDDRPEFASVERFPRAARVSVVPEFADCFRDILMDENAYAVILTRGHAHDAVALEQALATGAGYIGMIGSRRKRDAVYDALRRKGVSDAALARVHCPIGLPIGAETPGEIAVSIVGECVAHRRNAL